MKIFPNSQRYTDLDIQEFFIFAKAYFPELERPITLSIDFNGVALIPAGEGLENRRAL